MKTQRTKALPTELPSTKPQQLLFLIGAPLVLLGLLWIERNCSLPWLPQEFGWPWVLVDGSVSDFVFFDGLLLAGFIGVQLAASRFARGAGTRVLLAGVSFVALIAHWQNTGIVLFDLLGNAILSSLVSLLLFWTLMGIAWHQREDSRRFHAFALGAILLTPFLSLDRLLVFSAILGCFLAQLVLHRRQGSQAVSSST